MTKQDILDYFSLIDYAYNESGRLESLSRMIDELLKEQKFGYFNGYRDAFLKMWTPIEPKIVQDCRGVRYICGMCGATLYTIVDTASAEHKIQSNRFCPECGRAVKIGNME